MPATETIADSESAADTAGPAVPAGVTPSPIQVRALLRDGISAGGGGTGRSARRGPA